jgi:hypothetical protein
MTVNNSPAKGTIRRMVASDLAAFNPHRNALLAILIHVRKRGLGPAEFDTDKLWHDLTRLAEWYFWRERTKQEAIPGAARVKLLGQLAKALGRAHAVAKKDDVINDLFKASFEATNGPFTSAANQNIGSSAISRSLNVINKAVAGLLILETTARGAAANIHRPDGRPKGTSVLPPEYIVRLAMLFRSSTGTKPGAGEGPFARFVSAFLDAVGRAIAESAVFDAIKDARTRSLQQPSGWPPSPFK